MKLKTMLLELQFLVLAMLIGLVCPQGFANQHQASLENTDNQAWYTQDPQYKQDVQLRVDLFLSTTCPHCRAADRFFRKLETKKQWLTVHRYYINQDTTALDRLNNLVNAQKITINPFAVPAIFFCNARWLGFDSEKNTGKEIVKGLNYCHKQLIATGKLTPLTVNAIRKMGVSEWYEANIDGHPSWYVLIPTLAFLDALMSCSMVGLLVMFAFLVVTPQRSLRVGLGGLLLFCIGFIHYLQQVHTALFYNVIHGLRGLAVIVGLLLLGFLVSSYREKRLFPQLNYTVRGILFGCVAVLTVVGVYSYYQGCIPNYSLVFQQYLIAQSLLPQQQFIYTLFYQIIYLLALALLLLIALLVSARVKKYQQFLQRLISMVLLFAAGFLIMYPLLLQ